MTNGKNRPSRIITVTLFQSVSLVETASTSSEYCIQLEKEKRELIAQVEDLTPQLLSQQERAIHAEEMAQKMEVGKLAHELMQTSIKTS